MNGSNLKIVLILMIGLIANLAFAEGSDDEIIVNGQNIGRPTQTANSQGQSNSDWSGTGSHFSGNGVPNQIPNFDDYQIQVDESEGQEIVVTARVPAKVIAKVQKLEQKLIRNDGLNLNQYYRQQVAFDNYLVDNGISLEEVDPDGAAAYKAHTQEIVQNARNSGYSNDSFYNGRGGGDQRGFLAPRGSVGLDIIESFAGIQ